MLKADDNNYVHLQFTIRTFAMQLSLMAQGITISPGAGSTSFLDWSDITIILCVSVVKGPAGLQRRISRKYPIPEIPER